MLSMKNTLNALTSLVLFAGSPLMAEEAPELYPMHPLKNMQPWAAASWIPPSAS